MAARQLGKAVWARAKREYVFGNESWSQIAARLGVTKSAVEKHARATCAGNGGRSWDEQRRDFLARASAPLEANVADSLTLALGKRALEEIRARMDRDVTVIATSDLVAIAKLVRFQMISPRQTTEDP
jgi:hypothetical protein